MRIHESPSVFHRLICFGPCEKRVPCMPAFVGLFHRVMEGDSLFNNSFAAMISAESYPSYPGLLATKFRTISDSFAVAVSFKRSTVLMAGRGKPVSDFD
jgi:hypothetical protein